MKTKLALFAVLLVVGASTTTEARNRHGGAYGQRAGGGGISGTEAVRPGHYAQRYFSGHRYGYYGGRYGKWIGYGAAIAGFRYVQPYYVQPQPYYYDNYAAVTPPLSAPDVSVDVAPSPTQAPAPSFSYSPNMTAEDVLLNLKMIRSRVQVYMTPEESAALDVTIARLERSYNESRARQ